ncbi:hypothetical protein ACFSJY_18430 [Thalassotalea euphylliae]|uniref:hypothetical protein n=1 Tax=Thalassotalea euphylliae TaxID=1655234 RepID=UPI00362CA62C
MLTSLIMSILVSSSSPEQAVEPKNINDFTSTSSIKMLIADKKPRVKIADKKPRVKIADKKPRVKIADKKPRVKI